MAAASKRNAVAGMPEQFPVGMKVLVVDDDLLCLRIIEQMLRKCLYTVTTCSQATAALSLLRQRKGFYDVVLSDVHMPDMDGFKLLEFVGLEMDLPVIMMSGDDRTSLVMRGVRHGACDYLIKPVRLEELQNIWQHVWRKRCNESKEGEHSRSFEENDQRKYTNDDGEYASSINEDPEGLPKTHKKRKDAKDEEDGDLDNDDPTTSKKPRVVWSVELHQQFVSAVNQLGIDKAVPKRIMELMNVPGLTRENVASHLQKFRLYLKRLSGVSQQQGGLANSFGGCLEQNPKVGPLGGIDIQALVASGQISPEILAALRTEFLSRPAGNLVSPSVDQPFMRQASFPASKCGAVDQNVAYGQPLTKCPFSISKHFSPAANSVDSLASGYGSWSPKTLVNAGACSNIGGLGEENGSMVMSFIQRQPQYRQQQENQNHTILAESSRYRQQQENQNHTILAESSRLMNVQPSCLVVPSHSSASIAAGSNLAGNPNCSFSRNSVVNHNILVPQSNDSSFSAGKLVELDYKSMCKFDGLPSTGSLSSAIPSCSINANNATIAVQNSALTSAGSLLSCTPSNSMICGSYDVTLGKVLDHGLPKDTAFVGRGTTIPSRFAVDETEPPTITTMNQGRIYQEINGNKVKQEPSVNFSESGRVGVAIMQRHASNDLLSIFTD